MAKLRNATTDVGKFAQYLARKCVIHSPQAELDMTEKELQTKGKRFGTNRHYAGTEVHMIGSPRQDASEFIAISKAGRAMRVTVEEVNPEAYPDALRKAVGD